MDPRLKARRVEVARDRGRRRRRRLALLVLVVVLIGAAVGATQSPLLDVDRVQVSGGTHATEAAVRAAVGIRVGRSMVSVDPAVAQRRVEALPWVAEARVTRRWPASVNVVVSERIPVAVAGSGSVAVLVDRTGTVLGAAGDADHLPTVPMATPPAVGERLAPRARALVAVVDRLPPALRRQVAKALVRSDGLGLVLDDGVRVHLGDGTRLRAKSDAVLVLLDQADRQTIDSIDVSVHGSAAFTRHKGEGA